MSRARRHHFVPAFYLRRFADSGGRIERRERNSDDRLVLSVKDAAVEVDLYTVESDEGPSDVIERRLSDIEGMAASAMTRLDAGESVTVEDITGMVNFVAIQLTRGPDFRQVVDGFTTDILRKMMMLEAARGEARVREIVEESIGGVASDADVADAMEWMTRGDFAVSLHRNQAIEAMLESSAELVEPLAAKKWKVTTLSEAFLITCDRPVSLWKREPAPPFFGVGVLTCDEITLPISPTKALVIYPQPDADTEVPPSPMELNRRTIGSAHRWLFMDPGWSDRMRGIVEAAARLKGDLLSHAPPLAEPPASP